MPIIEYECKTGCGKTYERVFRSQAEREAYSPECPHCGTTEGLTKLVSKTSFRLEGGGWYKDGYASKK